MALTLYTHPMSCGHITRWMQREVGAPCETVVVEDALTMKAAPHLALNQMSKDVAAFFRWMLSVAGPAGQSVVNTSAGWIAATDKKGRTGYGTLGRGVATLTDHFANHRFACRDAFSAANVYLGSQIGWSLRLGAMPCNDVLAACWDRIKTRPAMARGALLDDALMKKD